MKTVYKIEIVNGRIAYDWDHLADLDDDAPKSPSDYFRITRQRMPEPIEVTGLPFSKVYITHGDSNDGWGVAYS